MEKGVLAGYPVIDIRIALVDGSFHNVDSSEMAFKIAGSLAFKKGAQEAGLILLEPYVNMEIRVMDHAATADFVNGHKHDQLAQRGPIGKIGRLFVPPIYDFGRLCTGQAGNYLMVADPVNDAFHAKAMATTNVDEIKKI